MWQVNHPKAILRESLRLTRILPCYRTVSLQTGATRRLSRNFEKGKSRPFDRSDFVASRDLWSELRANGHSGFSRSWWPQRDRGGPPCQPFALPPFAASLSNHPAGYSDLPVRGDPDVIGANRRVGDLKSRKSVTEQCTFDRSARP